MGPGLDDRLAVVYVQPYVLVHRRHHCLLGIVGRVDAYGFVLQRYAMELHRPFLCELLALHLPTDESPPDIVSSQCIDGDHERPRCALPCYCEVVEVADRRVQGAVGDLPVRI